MFEFLDEPIPITSQQWREGTIPLVSISCITYNHENFIRDAIEGFLMQKTTFPVEILIHDDASTDKTAEIVREYEKKYPQLIKPIYQTENQYSKKEGVITQIQNERTKGKYIAKCEGDDYWIDPLKLQKQVDFLESNPDYSMCFHNAIVLESSIKGNISYMFNKFSADCDLMINDIVSKWVVPTASIMFREELKKNPSWVNQIYSGDFALLLNMYTKGKIRYLNSISSIYRKNFLGKSVSITINTNYVRQQHIKLLESFNQGTERKYNKIITKRIKELTKEIAFRETIYTHKYFKLFKYTPQILKNSIRIFKNHIKYV